MEAAFNLEKFIIPRQEIELVLLEKINRKLEELSLLTLGIEASQKEELAKQKSLTIYERINPEFLRSSHEREFEFKNDIGTTSKKTLRVPKFGIFCLTKNLCFLKYGKISSSSCFYFDIGVHENLPKILRDQFALGSYIFDDCKKISYSFRNHLGLEQYRRELGFAGSESREIKRAKQEQLSFLESYNCSFSTNFSGLLPEKTRRAVYEARSLFNDQIYIATETKPEEWEIKDEVNPKDYCGSTQGSSLLLGVLGNDCFLIDRFIPEKLEDYRNDKVYKTPEGDK
jgi:hypothetical protein